MRRSLWVAITFAASGLSVQANDGVESTLKARALASAAMVRSISQAPFTSARDPLPRMILLDEQERRGWRGTCQYSAKDLCYDLAAGRIVFRPIRQYMPKIHGLTPENISVRRDRVVFRYSFR